MPPARRRLLLALGLYAALSAVYLASADPARVWQHTPYNHFALQARAWLDGRLDLGQAPPDYAQFNDFARLDGRWFVAFPALPALLIVPAVAVAESVEHVRDGQFFLWWAGAAPALLFLALERLRDLGRSPHATRVHLALAAAYGLGTVHWFIAVQGTVWFAAHVIGSACAALYLLASLGGDRPLLAGLALGLGYWSRSPLLFAFPLFVVEATHAALRRGTAREVARDLARRLALFALPIALLLALSFAHNRARFGDPFEVGYRYLTVAWSARIARWGLFSYHYLARNLGVALTSLPFSGQSGPAPFQISAHGLALWLTTPLYLLLPWPRRSAPGVAALALTALAVALPSLLYQNTGQLQFGYRFSDDYAVFLFALLALGRPRFGRVAVALAVVGVIVSGFGALTFDRARWGRFYTNPNYAIYQPD